MNLSISQVHACSSSSSERQLPALSCQLPVKPEAGTGGFLATCTTFTMFTRVFDFMILQARLRFATFTQCSQRALFNDLQVWVVKDLIALPPGRMPTPTNVKPALGGGPGWTGDSCMKNRM